VLALAACGGSGQPAKEPQSETRTTGVVVETGPASPGDPGGISSGSGGPTVTSGAPASPMEGECPRAKPPLTDYGRTECVKSCRGLDETVPVGSKCASQYESCTAQCNRKFRSR